MPPDPRDSRAVFVWAPTQRCGTGLLQRLITSSGEALVYGEDSLLAKVLPTLILDQRQRQRFEGGGLDALAEGDPTGWYTRATPPPELAEERLLDCFYGVASDWAAEAERRGFARWGAKFPDAMPTAMTMLAELLPNAQHLVLVRDLRAVLPSAKARGWVNGPRGAAAYAKRWAERLQAVQGLPDQDPRFRTLRYEDLLADPEAHLAALEGFLGLPRMDRAVLQHRVNAPGAGYAPPVGLTEQEAAVAKQLAESARRQWGYPPW